jgi:hypothetical protein
MNDRIPEPNTKPDRKQSRSKADHKIKRILRCHYESPQIKAAPAPTRAKRANGDKPEEVVAPGLPVEPAEPPEKMAEAESSTTGSLTRGQ